MQRPPRTPDGRPVTDRPTRRSVAAGYVAIATVPVLLWAVANPLAAPVVAAALASAVGALRIAAPRVRRLVDCVRECCCATVGVGESVRVTVSLGSPGGA